MKRLVSVTVSALAIVVLGGCMNFYSSRKVVGENVERAKVKFENDTAVTLFYSAIRKHGPTTVQSTRIGVPFVTFYSSSKVLSENAMFNKVASICDVDGDGTITEQEATTYYSRCLNRPVDLDKVMDKAHLSVGE